MLSNLNEMLVKGRKAMFGKSSEQLSNIDGAEQEYSAKADEPTVETVNVKSHPRRKRLSREELPDSVEHKKIVIDLDDKKCPECGEELVCIGEEFVCSKLNIIPAQISVLDFYQKKYKCKSCEKKDPDNISIIKPEMPVPVIKKSMASAGAIAYVIQQKYPRFPLKRKLHHFCFADSRLRFSYENHKNDGLEHRFTGRNNTGKRRVLTLTGQPWRTG